MSQVSYTAYLESIDKWSTLDTVQFLFLEGDQLIIQGVPDRANRNPSNVLEQFTLDHKISAVSRSPSVGFSWGCSTGRRKFQVGHRFAMNEILMNQVKFPSTNVHAAFTRALLVYIPIQASTESLHNASQSAPSTISNRHDEWNHSQSAVVASMNSRGDAYSEGQAHTPSTNTRLDWPQPHEPIIFQPQPQRLSTEEDSSMLGKLPTTMTVSTHPTYPPLKMPTPVTKDSVETKEPHLPRRYSLEGARTSDTLSEVELESLFMEFLKDDRNIALCDAVERIWIKAGMQQ